MKNLIAILFLFAAGGVNAITIEAPKHAENGAVVPFKAVFTPPLSKDDVVEVYANETLAYSVTVTNAVSITALGGRVRMTGSGDIVVKTKTAGGIERAVTKTYVDIGRPSAIPVASKTKHTSESTAYKRASVGGELKLLLVSDMAHDNYINLVTLISTEGLIFVNLTPVASANPFIGIAGNFSPNDTQATISVSEEFKPVLAGEANVAPAKKVDIVSAPISMTPQQLTSFIAAAKSNVTKDFKDPFSVQWRNLFVSQDGTLKILCGELNGKNSYGAYIGFRRFFATDSVLQLIEDPKTPSIMNGMWPKVCGNKVADVVVQ